MSRRRICGIAEKRALELIAGEIDGRGEPSTLFTKYGDTVCIEMFDAGAPGK